ncbi:MAG: response regulator [Gemmatimonadales bacterium]|nr:response regulator [Gemmatimonadales bacterium]MDQ3426615.1 ATP-binding protein [Gemmatimonadota bacterium]
MEAVGLLAGGVAHDFNNLLTVIQATSELLLEEVPDQGEIREDIRQIHKAADRAATLTRQLLAFSRRQMLQPVTLDLNDVVHDIESLLGRLIGKHITLSAVLGGALGTVQADRGQLEQVIMNLAVNARDAMPHGGTLTIETANVTLDETYAARRSVARPGRYVMLALSDTGTGMDAETKGRIFEPFFTTKSRTEGTGLGLATVYGIVKQSGGYIWVYSEPGRGTTFKVYLPRIAAPAEARGEKTGGAVRAVGGSETILLVEDEDQVRALARRALERQGYQVLEAPHGQEAIAICRRYPMPINLVLTDIVMPQLGGRALADWLAVERPAVKVVFMSGYTDGDLGRQGVLDSAVAYVQKPFTAAGLAAVVRGVLDGPTAAGPRTPARDARPRLATPALPESASHQ